MSDDLEDGMEFAAAELVARVKQAEVDDTELLVPDETCIWVVSVKRLGIQTNRIIE